MKRSGFAFALVLIGTLAFTRSLSAADAAEPAEPARPLLVTVDDLPLTAGQLHTDAAERETLTKQLLAVLAHHRIKAVGLVTWGNLRGERETALLDLWLAAGHELGNHANKHLDYTRTAPEVYIADIEEARAKLTAYLSTRGQELRFFRFPMLREGDTPEKLTAMRTYLARTGQRNLPPTIDDQDWSFEERIVKAQRGGDARALATAGEDYQASLRLSVDDQEGRGDRLFARRLPQILLLHAGAAGATEWDRLFTWLTETGHRFATADEVLADPVFKESPENVAPYGYGLWDRWASEKRKEKARDQVAALLSVQAQAWNRGDFAAFCAPYSDDTLFISPSGMTRGRDAVEQRYRAKYPDAARRGTLSFEVIEMRPVSGVEFTPMGDARPGRVQGISLVARWTLSFPGKPASTGLTLLNLVPRGDGWAIVQDASM
ncbi:MAG: polysaccharide deacetylase family protein [Thermoanaerobaculia bacterium]